MRTRVSVEKQKKMWRLAENNMMLQIVSIVLFFVRKAVSRFEPTVRVWVRSPAHQNRVCGSSPVYTVSE